MKSITSLLLTSMLASVSLQAQESTPVDPKRAERVPVVLRVRLTRAGEGSKYLWPEVELVEVIKNESSYTFPKHFEVAVYSWERSIPAGTSTIYLERYSSQCEDLWRLLAGSATTGVSDTVDP